MYSQPDSTQGQSHLPHAPVVIALPSSKGAFLEQMAQIPISVQRASGKRQNVFRAISEASAGGFSPRCTLALSSCVWCWLSRAMRPLGGVLSSQMIIHVYMEAKTPEETSAMMGSGSVHTHRKTQALSHGVNDPRGKHSLRQFGDAFPV